VQVPFLFKYTVDALATPEATAAAASVPDMHVALGLAGVPVALIGAYGCARAGGVIMSELRNAVFAKVAQGAIRQVGGEVCTSSRCVPDPLQDAKPECSFACALCRDSSIDSCIGLHQIALTYLWRV
jgi:hypothetical protein